VRDHERIRSMEQDRNAVPDAASLLSFAGRTASVAIKALVPLDGTGEEDRDIDRADALGDLADDIQHGRLATG
jgi:hypothetical protein